MSDLGNMDSAETLGEFAKGMLDTISEWETADAMSAKADTPHIEPLNGCAADQDVAR